MRVLIRDAEWVVRQTDLLSGPDYRLICDGVSEIVRGQEAHFLSALEDSIEPLDPAETKLKPDRSPRFANSRLYMESQLRQTVPNDEHIHVGHQAAMDVVQYQLKPTRQALRQPRQRILIADAVGLGKTLEAGILVSELIARGRGRRILVLAVKSMLTQFQKEFWNRFTIPLTRLDSIGIQRVRRRIPTNHNPFHYFDKSIISIDTLKQDAEYRTYLESASWDIIVIDEAHNVADRGTGSQRSRLAKMLSRRADTLIMLSATPHDGRARSFASLMNMLDPTAITDPDDYTQEDFQQKGLVIRRFKKDIKNEVREAFKDRQVFRSKFTASEKEERAFDALLDVRVAERADSNGRTLFSVSLEKALFSSPAACIQTIDERLRRRERESGTGWDADIEAEVESLNHLRQVIEEIDVGDYAKYRALLDVIQGGEPFDWKPDNPRDRLVIFTERIETLRFLEQNLMRDLRLRKDQLEVLYGGMSDIDQQEAVENFGNAERPVRLLICSDVASEGINLHYHCHRLIHFDMPWSLMVFQQRNGRVDRYGQKDTPHIVYLVTESANETIRGDMRILDVLASKDEQAYKNIGDPSVFMNVHDIDKEEEFTSKAIAKGEDSKGFDGRLTQSPNEGDDLLALFLGTADEQEADTVEKIPPPPRSLYENDLQYCEAALNRLRNDQSSTRRDDLHFTINDRRDTLTLDASDDLRQHFEQCPREVFPENGRFRLTISREEMNRAIVESRHNEVSWPRQHYLWRLNPVVGWLNDRMLAAFGRHEAPVLAGVPGLAPNETVFVLSGLVPNRKSHPLVYEWIGASFQDGKFQSLVGFEELIERTRINTDAMNNRTPEVDVRKLEAMLPKAVDEARKRFVERRDEFEEAINVKLNTEYENLASFKKQQHEQLELKLAASDETETRNHHRADQKRREIDTIFDKYLSWIESTMTTEKTPYIKVVCAMTGAA